MTSIPHVQRLTSVGWAVTFIAGTYALYDRTRAVLVGLVSLALAGIAASGVSDDD